MDFLPDLDFNWLANFDQEDYTILNPTIDAISKGKQIDAMLKFFTDLGGMYLQDEAEDKSMTALNAYTELFQGTGKTVHLVDNFHANTLNYQKNQSRLERFHYYNTRFNAEFVVRGDAVYLYNRIGSYKPDVRIDEDLNVKSATVEIDSENFFTWCHCYYDLEESESGADGENYLQEAVYVNQELYDEYGDIEGPALYQGAIKYESTMLEYAREQQEKSIQVSHSVELVDLQRQGYGEFIFHIGDTVRLSLSSIDITLDIRVVEINETFVENAHGEWERTELSLTLGNASKVQSYKQSRNDSLQDLDDWINGRREPPMSVVPAAIRRAADIVMGDTDSVMEYRKDRLIGWHSKNEGNNVQLNVSGLVLHQNGVPKTAITPWGIVADTITTGMLNTNNVLIQGSSGRLTIDGDVFTMRNTSGDITTEIRPGYLGMSRTNFELGGGADIHFNDSGNRMYFDRHDTVEDVTRPAGFGVGTNVNDRFPYAYMGTTEYGALRTSEARGFSGFIANTRKRYEVDGIQNSVNGDSFQVRDKVTASDKVIEFKLDATNRTARIIPWNTSQYYYHLGYENQRFARAYIDGLYSGGGAMFIRNQNSDFNHQGWRMEVAYSGNNEMTFRGINSNDYYNLGASGWEFSYAHIKNVLSSSDERLKDNIKDNRLGLDFINDISTKTFNRLNVAEARRDVVNNGVIAQELLPVLCKYGVNATKTSLINLGDDGYYSVDYIQLVIPAIKSIQELSVKDSEKDKRIRELEVRIKKLEES